MALQIKSGIIVFALAALGWTSFCLGQPPQPTPALGSGQTPEPPQAASSGQPLPEHMPGSIRGVVVDQSGAVIAGAQVALTRAAADPSLNQLARSGDDGQFSFASIAAGPFQLTFTAAGFATQTTSGILHPGEICVLPQIALAVATNIAEVQVRVSQVEVAEEEIRIEEKQRVLGVLPNFYVTYIPDAAPLDTKQKFKLAWKMMVDPFTLAIVGGIAGVEQAQNSFPGYEQGAEGYGKRLGASYADAAAGTFIGAAVLPALLKQDPRYFYKGTGSKRSRILYALANSVICKGDNGRWQANYSNILGSLAAGGISNLYYPAQDRNGASLTFENAAIGIGATGVANLFQEFLVKKLSRKVPSDPSAAP